MESGSRAIGTNVNSAAEPLPIQNLRELGNMTLSIAHLQPIVSLIAGVAILIVPRLLNYIVAAFLIVSGLLGLGLIR